jgi:hypothetical protein
VTGRAVIGDFLDAARGQLGSAAHLRLAAGRGGDLREISHSLLRVVTVMNRYVQDFSAVPRQVPSREPLELATWERASLEARNALTTAAVLLRGDGTSGRSPDMDAGSELARRLDAAWLSLAAGRDLLHTHLTRALSGIVEPRSEWGPVITSRPATRALLAELALLAHQIAPVGASLALPPRTHGTPDARRRLTAACEWLHMLDTSIRTAHQDEPVSVADRELLHAIPVNWLQPRRLPEGTEPVEGLCGGVITAAERARHAAWASASVTGRSPAMSVSSLRQAAAASTLTSHHCEILLRSLSTRTARDGPAELSAGLLVAAEAARGASRSWLSVAHALDDVTTDTQGLSRAATAARDLALWTGRLAYADPHWTLASGPSHEARPPQTLAPQPDDVPGVVAAVHYACDAMTGFAHAGREQVRAGAGVDRILVAAENPPDIWDIPMPYVRAPRERIDAILALYQFTSTASADAAASAADAATVVKATSSVLATARSATDAGRQGGERLASTGSDPSAAGKAREEPGPVGRILHGLGVTSPDLLRRGADIDRVGKQLIIEATAENEPWGRQANPATLGRSIGTAVSDSHARKSGDRRTTLLEGDRVWLLREPPEAEA